MISSLATSVFWTDTLGQESSSGRDVGLDVVTLFLSTPLVILAQAAMGLPYIFQLTSALTFVYACETS